MGTSTKGFWRGKMLDDLSEEEWEALCDGCARCCLVKLEDERTEAVHYTNVACRFLDMEACRCTVYECRSQREPNCLLLNTKRASEYDWLPSTCAYRLIAIGKELPAWHPLLSGDRNSVHRAGISIRGKVCSERDVPENEMVDHIVVWEMEKCD
jgi:uncharacterized cysteine cluster protein YcgN (CxxCxxCC family)